MYFSHLCKKNEKSKISFMSRKTWVVLTDDDYSARKKSNCHSSAKFWSAFLDVFTTQVSAFAKIHTQPTHKHHAVQ